MSEESRPHGTGDADEEMEQKAKSAEDRKAAAALSKLDAHGDDDDDDATRAREVDQEAMSRAMNSLDGVGAGKKAGETKEVKKIKLDAADVAFVMDELELTKAKATELLKMHDGDAVKAIRAFIAPL